MEGLEGFLTAHRAVGGWEESWLGVPLGFQVYLTDQTPPAYLVASVRAVVLRGPQVLVVHTQPPHLSVGGRPEAGETWEEALVREVAEETGWQVRPLGQIGFTHVRHRDAQRPGWGRPAPDFFDLLYAAEAHTHTPEQKHPSEPECRWINPQAAASYGLHPIDPALLAAALRQRPKQ